MSNIKLTSVCAECAKVLGIETSKIAEVPKLDTETKIAAYDDNTDTIYIRASASLYDKAFAIAHEMRHKWQNKHFSDSYSITNTTVEEYNLRPEEVDANAFGFLFMQSAFGVKPLFNGLSEEIRQKIYERAKEINQ